jgi:hypothetical protein
VSVEMQIEDSSGQGVKESFVRVFKTHCDKIGFVRKHGVHCNVCCTLGVVFRNMKVCLHIHQGFM